MSDESRRTPSFLIVRLGALGDIVHGLPVAAALRAAHPAARIDWLVDVRHRAVVELIPALTRAVLVDTRRWSGASGLRQVLADLRRTRYGVALDLQGLLKSAALARLSGAGRVIGFDRRQVRERWASLAYTDAIDPGARTHVTDRGLSLLVAAGIPAPARLEFPLRVPASDIPAAVRQSLGLNVEDPFIVINPGAAWPNKRWPAARFGETAAQVHARCGVRAVVLWGPGEDGLAASVAAASGGAAVSAPPTSIPDLIAVLAAARLVVSGDSGPLHVAAALGTAVVGLFGPTDPHRNGPWATGDVVVSRSPQCRCAHQRRCTAAQWCLDTVAVPEVTAAIIERLTRS